MGDCGETVSNPTIKLSLNVMVAFSVSFLHCMFCGTSWSSTLFPNKCCLTIAGHLFSKVWILGFMSLFLKYV